MGDRPQPYLHPRWRELVIPPEDLADLAAWLTELCEVRSGRARPAAVRQTRVTAKLAAYRDIAERGAREVAAASSLRSARPASPPVVVPAQTAAASGGDEITTTQAADLTGKSRERMRQLAASGRVRARRIADRAWLLDRADVIALNGRSTTDGPRGSEEQPGPSAA